MRTLHFVSCASDHAASTALRCGDSSFPYQTLLDSSARFASRLLGSAPDLLEARVAMLLPPGPDYVAALWGIWRAGGVALPLGLSATEAELAYALEDAGVSCVISNSNLAKKIPLAVSTRLILAEDAAAEPIRELPGVDSARRAMILYTSGTTNKPKGVVTTHANIAAQIESLVEAWRWSPGDRIPMFLPLHHIHGIINVLSCALHSGACVDVFARFDASEIFPRVARRD